MNIAFRTTTAVTDEVWALWGDPAVTSRTQQLIDEAEQENRADHRARSGLHRGDDSPLTRGPTTGVDVIVGTITEPLREQVQEALPETEVFVSELEWLSDSTLPGDNTEINRLILVDRETILVSSFTPSAAESWKHEQAVFGRGFDNGLVTNIRRLMSTGLLASTTPVREARPT